MFSQEPGEPSVLIGQHGSCCRAVLGGTATTPRAQELFMPLDTRMKLCKLINDKEPDTLH